uniref:Putative ficolin n=1 Tax=Anopheles triannulatus TaxID=58253 RepID=A0A2M4A9G2_9DIPT
MKGNVWFVVICAVLAVRGSDREDTENVKNSESRPMGFEFKILSDQFYNISAKLQSIENILQNLEIKQQNMSDKLDSIEEKIQKTEGEDPVTATENSASTTTKPKPKQPPFSSCKDVPSNVSGTYLIRVKNDSEPFQVYCEQEAYGGGWIVFQYRYNGSLDFYRGWNEFRDGFGDLNKEFWLGLEKVHQITSGRKHELIVELKDFNGTYGYARYAVFELGSERNQYILKELGKYSGNAGDSMSFNKGFEFSTKDEDNDMSSSLHCAQRHEGAWWHGPCTFANLNGRYRNVADTTSMYWMHFTGNQQGLNYLRMMIRELE